MTRARLCLAAVVIVSVIAALSCERRRETEKGPPAATTRPAGDAGAADAKPPPPDATPPLPPLESWDVGEGKQKSVWVRARDVEVGWLVWELARPEKTLRRHRPTETISGTAEAPRDALIAFLRARLGPDAKSAKPRRIRGRGRKVDLFFYGAPVHNVLRLLASVGGVNLAVAPDPDLRIDISFEGVPWDGLLDAIVAVADLKVHRFGELYLVTSGKPPARNGQFGDERVDLISGPAPLGPLLSLLEGATGAALTAPCEVTIVNATAHRATVSDLAQMLAVWSGEEILPLPNECPVPPTIDPEVLDRGDWTLVAIARGKKAAALLRDGATYALLPEGDEVALKAGSAVVNGAELLIDWGHEDPFDPVAVDALEIRAWIVGEKEIKVLGHVGDLAAVVGNRSFAGLAREWRREGDALVVVIDGEEKRLELP